MKAAIKDANILIDLIESSLLDCWFMLEIETVTTDFVVAEIDDPKQREVLDAYINSELLVVVESSDKDITEIYALEREAPSGISFEDCSVLRLAKQRRALLMTGDGRLRKYAEVCDVEVRGTLWILDKLVEKEIITPLIALTKLRFLQTIDRRLPYKESEQRLRSWARRRTK